MRAVWSETHKRALWRRIWVALARTQHSLGLVTAEQVADLEAHMHDVDVEAALAIEARIHHDLMAEVQAYAQQCPIGGGIIHLGATSADIEDNADALRLRESLHIVLTTLSSLLGLFASQIEETAEQTVMAFTHLQPAEPTTLGYRLALYAQDLLEDYMGMRELQRHIRGKGFKGAVGTAASYAQLLDGTPHTPETLESLVMSELDLLPYPITGQTYPRKLDWQIISALAGLASSLYKFAFDLRVLQSPMIGELGEPFARLQVGSSAMPFKRNPINSEKTDSLGRLIVALTQTAWENASHSLLERTLDDSANRREMLPIAFLAADEMLNVTKRTLANLRIDPNAIQRNLSKYGSFAALERILMASVKYGADRQHIHEVLREYSMQAWATVSADQPNPLEDLLINSVELRRYLTIEQIRSLLDASTYVGTAPKRAREFAATIRSVLAEDHLYPN